MKTRLHHVKIVNLKLIGAVAGAVSLILYPVIAKAENSAFIQEQQNFTDEKSPKQEELPQQNVLFSPSLPIEKRVEITDELDVEEGRRVQYEQLSATKFSILAGDLNPCSAKVLSEVKEQKISALCPETSAFDVKLTNQPSTASDTEFVGIKPFQPASNTQLPQGLQQTASGKQLATGTIQTFQPASEIQLPKGLQQVASISEQQSATAGIQPFQATSDIKLPRGLQKIANGTEDAGQQVNKDKDNSAVSQTPTPAIATTVKILTPTPDEIVDVAATTVILEFPEGASVELRVNGQLVDTSQIGRTATDSTTKLVMQTWYGVSLKEGENTITAQIVGSTAPSVSRRVVVRGAPTQMKLETVEARIPADGRSTATVKGQLLDANNNRSKWNSVVTLAASAGEFIGADFKPDQPGFQVEVKEGEFTAKLKSSLNAQTITIKANANELEAFTRLQFETSLRPSILTGVVDLRLGARGTNYYGSFRDFLRPDRDNRTQLDFNSAVFATGAIGDWLFTGAYNSSRSLNEDCNCDNRLFRSYQFSEQNYPVYGDSSRVDVVAPSIDSVFVRLERSTGIPGATPDYAMWGDYNTEEFARPSQQFTAITRQLHGFKANYNLGNFQITGFYGNHLEGFQRDTIAPDGTSGYYFLSRRILLPGSENVFLELEELNRPGTVLERKQLNRGPDYEIDYDRGTLIFRQPILRTDVDQYGQVLVRRIVVTYQYDSKDSNSNIYAGRLQYNFSRTFNNESWLGATYIKENQGVRGFELYGADAMISLGSQGKVVAEYAHSTNDSDVMGKVSGEAYRIEAEGEILPGIQGRAYYRFADTGFANNATISFVPGQTRYGAQLTGQVSQTTNVRVQYDHEDNFGIAPQPLDTFEELFSPRSQAVPGSKVDNSLTTISAGIQQKLGSATVNVDWIHRNRDDRIATNALRSNSDQLRSRLSIPLANNLTFQAQNETTLSSTKDAVYPDRTILGLNWAVIPGINVSLAQQFYSGGQLSGNSITSLSVNGEHKLGTDTTITGRYSILGGANELTTQGAIGLNNRWSIAPGLRLNLAYEHVFGSFFQRTGAGQQFAQPFAPGQSASSIGFDGGDSYSVGLEYSDNPDFQASARYEHRSSSGGSNTLISAGATGKISPSLTALVRYQQANSSNQRLTGLGDTVNLKVGLAYRDPSDDKFNALLRYEYRQNPSSIPDTILLGSGTGSQDHTFALEAIYAPNWQWEFYGKYALRQSTTYLASDLAGTSTVNLAQFRATYRLGYSMDLVGEARVINQSNYTETGFVIEAGYYLSPNLRVAAGYVFGQVDDRDFSGTRSAGGPYLGLTLKLNELFDGFGQQKVAPPQQQESVVQPVVDQTGETGKLKI
ncbi:MAG: TonB-dependent receptor [Aulosira sp. DedQUE10]|nr:TonB-dependent receptor [Aulosira sp. DedQUE10]